MDDPQLAPALHMQALAGLRRINRFSRSAAILWPHIHSLAKQICSERSMRVLDVASGGGDVAIALAQRARSRGIPIEVHGCDISSTAVDFATQQAHGARPAQTKFFQLDALTADLPVHYDVVTCSLFLHHLSEANAVLLLRKMATAARHMVLVNDLRRTSFGYKLAWVGCRLLSRSSIVHVDGPRSVEGAFSDDEVQELACEAGLTSATIEQCWPQRFLLAWSKR